MNNSTLPHPSHSIATSLVIKNIRNEISLRAKNLRDVNKPNLAYMQARLEVIKDLGFENEYMVSEFYKELESCSENVEKDISKINSFNRQLKDNVDYYAFVACHNLIRDDTNHSISECVFRVQSIGPFSSHWVGFEDDNFEVELRVADQVSPKSIIDYVEELKIPVLIINTIEELFFWKISYGGIALIPSKLVKSDNYLSRWLSPYPQPRTLN